MKTKQIDLEIERLIMLKNRNELTETGIELLDELISVKKQLILHDVVEQSEVELCECNYPLVRTGTKERPEYCGNCEKDI